MFSLPSRLPRQAFETLIKKGTRRSGAYITVWIFDREDKRPTRVAVSVSKKFFKKAVDRNRLKRQLREVVRAHWGDIPVGRDMLIAARGNPTGVTFAKLMSEFASLVPRS